MTFLRHLAWQWHWILLHLAVCTLPWLLHGDDAGLKDTRRLLRTAIMAWVVITFAAAALDAAFWVWRQVRKRGAHGRALKALRQDAEVEA